MAALAFATVLLAVPKPALAVRATPPASETANVKPLKAKRRRPWGQHQTGPFRIVTTSPWQRSRVVEDLRRSRIDIVLAAARAQLGKPYVYATEGPSTFDCSGLTKFVWGAAGIDLPHNSDAQYDTITHVSLDQMRPGDLVFFPGHVGLYVGDGQMIHAPQTGDVVRVSPVHDNAFGAGRPA